MPVNLGAARCTVNGQKVPAGYEVTLTPGPELTLVRWTIRHGTEERW
jgi:hypothetical protein